MAAIWPKTGSTITNRLPCRSDLENHSEGNLLQNLIDPHGSPLSPSSFFKNPFRFCNNLKNFEEVSLPRTKDEWSNDGGQGDNGSDVEVQHCSFLLDKHLQKHSWLAKNSEQRI